MAKHHTTLHQTGTSIKKFDITRSAQAPGFHMTPAGGYYEYRANRTDLSRKKKL